LVICGLGIFEGQKTVIGKNRGPLLSADLVIPGYSGCVTLANNEEKKNVSNLNDSFSEPYGREQSVVQNNHYISLVPTLLGHSLPQQEGFTGRENHVLASRRLLSRIRW